MGNVPHNCPSRGIIYVYVEPKSENQHDQRDLHIHQDPFESRYLLSLVKYGFLELNSGHKQIHNKYVADKQKCIKKHGYELAASSYEPFLLLPNMSMAPLQLL